MQPLTHKQYLLQKFPGKGGWTYAEIPEVPMDKHAHFGWVCVKGSIDGHSFEQYRLMPLGNGKLFFPVKAATRKKIGKQAGDWVTIKLYPDTIRLSIPPEWESCMKDEPEAYAFFKKMKESEQKEMIDWIYAVKGASTRVDRMVKAITFLLAGKTLGSLRKQKATAED